MHIILVSNRLAKARTLHITPRLLAGCAVGIVVLCFATSFLFSYVGVSFNLPFAADLVASVQRLENRKNEEYIRDNLSAMAVKLGDMQAQLMRLDLLGERVSKQSGIPLPKKDDATRGGKGGPLIPSQQPFTVFELQHEIERLAESVEQSADALTALESQLTERRIKTTLLPTIVPINANYIGSTFGRRIDPIAGISAMHEGIDFVADVGTPIVASAGGVVIAAERHPQYGNLIEIDHGNDFSSRYAHLHRLDVKPGQIVKRGQQIGLSGNTGRSTGPHLHFEVRFRGAPQNPARFLSMASSLSLASRGETHPNGLPPLRRAPAAGTARSAD